MRKLIRFWVGALLIAGVAASPWMIATAEDERVIRIIDAEHFKPPNTNISPGDKLRWRNDGTLVHSAKSRPGAPAAFDTGEIPAGKTSKEFTFTKVGEYKYDCTLHPGNEAVFFVVEQEPDFSPSPQQTPEDLSTAQPEPDGENDAPPPQADSATPSPPPTPSPSPSPTARRTPSPSPSPTRTPVAASGSNEDGGPSLPVVLGIIGLLLAAGAGGGLWWYRRTRATP